MKYRLPTLGDLDILKEYVEEHYSNYERSISASNGLTNMDYNKWVDKINRNSETADDDWGKYYLYLVLDENEKLVGLLNIRYNLTNELRERYGDIGYGVRPSERRKGYATKMLEQALKICREKNMKDVILGCYENNYGSNKTIIKNGGILYRTNYEEKQISDEWTLKLKCNYYKIEL
jgi:predicted acetyltransferase